MKLHICWQRQVSGINTMSLSNPNLMISGSLLTNLSLCTDKSHLITQGTVSTFVPANSAMFIQQIYTNCLAEASYYVESEGSNGREAVIIDPLRDIDTYTAIAHARNARIKYVFETHFHADFVSGHVTLSEKTGAPIIYGPTTTATGFEKISARDGQEFPLGNCKMRLLHTPGHTMESACYLLLDEHGNEQALFSGDTLFIGDVGRPDLAQKVVADLTPEKLAGHLYESLRSKIMPLPDHIVVYPNHGAGSACGKNMSKETSDTLGHQKMVNYALNPALTKAEFTKQVLEGLTPPPTYFPRDIIKNIQGYDSIDHILSEAKCFTAAEFKKAIPDCIVIDCRGAQEFAKAFIPGSVNIGLDGDFAAWAGTLIGDITKPILLVAEPGREKEAITRLARVGCDNIEGFLRGGFKAWAHEGYLLDTINSVDAIELKELESKGIVKTIDVRRESEFAGQHLEQAINIPLEYVNDLKSSIDKHTIFYVYCAGGYRSITFISLLRLEGWNRLVNINGGFNALRDSGMYKLEEHHTKAML